MYTQKKKVILQFRDLNSLWQFARRIQANELEINTDNKSLCCNCSEADLSLAIEFYHAVVAEEMSF